MMQNVSAVIVTYNRLKLLKEVIESLQNQETPTAHIIVIDNDSEQDTKDYLESLGSLIDYVRLPENIGGAGGFNAGIRYFMEHTTDDYVWLMDDDTVPQSNTLTELLDFAKTKNNFGFLASDVRWTDGSKALMNGVRPLNDFKKMPENQDKPIKVQNATFVSLLMQRKVVKQIGLPIAEFFIWGDDIEYTDRASRVAPGYYVPSAKVTHKMGANIGSNILIDGPSRTPRYFYAYRNKVYYVRQRSLYKKVRSNVSMLVDELKIKFSKTDRKQEKLAVFKKGIEAGKTFNPKIEFANDLKEKNPISN